MAEVRDGRFSELLRRHLLIAGQDASVPELAEQLVATLPLEVDRPEWRFLTGERLAIGVVGIGSVVAEWQTAQLFNPAGSGLLCVLEEALFNENVSSTGLPRVMYYDAALGTVGTAGVRDRRYDVTNPFRVPTVQVRGVSTGTDFGTQFSHCELLGHVFEASVAAATQWIFRGPLILAPGTGVLLKSSAVNRTVSVTFRWTERQLNPWEVATT